MYPHCRQVRGALSGETLTTSVFSESFLRIVSHGVLSFLFLLLLEISILNHILFLEVFNYVESIRDHAYCLLNKLVYKVPFLVPLSFSVLLEELFLPMD